MKLLDIVKVKNDRYIEQGIKKDMIGTIIDADIRWNSFYVSFQDQRVYDKEFMKNKENVFKLKQDITIGVLIKDLELVSDGGASDELIRISLPENHKNYWCKVEDGYITNLGGERKNKTPFDYES